MDVHREFYSYVVGFGKRYPHRAQHQAASCPTDGNCSWGSAFWPGRDNPNQNLVSGALVAGPDFKERYVDDRTFSNSKVAVHYNVGLLGAIAGLTQTQTDANICGQGNGVYQEVFHDLEL